MSFPSRFEGSPRDVAAFLCGLTTSPDAPSKVVGVHLRYAVGIGRSDGPEAPMPSVVLTCRWQFVEQPPELRETRNYGRLELREEFIPLPDACTRLLSFIDTGELAPELTVSTSTWANTSSAHREVDRSPRRTLWPEWNWSLGSSIKEQHWYTQWRPVLMPGLRPYEYVGEAVGDWVWPEHGRQRGNDPPHTGRIIVIVPDTRARLVLAEWKAGRLRVTIDRNVQPDRVELQLLFWRRGSNEPVVRLIPAPGLEVEEDLPPGTESIDVYLLVDGQDVAGQAEIRSEGQLVEPHVGPKSAQEQADEDLPLGENTTIEFKPFIQPKNEKEWEAVETVVAFANTKGGRLYIGLNRNGSPEGTKGLANFAKDTRDQTPEKLKQWVKDLVQEKVKPVPETDADVVTVAGEMVLVLRVEEGEGKPYSTHENIVYVRKGSTNCRPDVHSELAAMFRSTKQAFAQIW